MTAHDPAKNIIRTPEDIGAITGTMSDILNGRFGYRHVYDQWKIERSECGTVITFTDIAAQTALKGTPVPSPQTEADPKVRVIWGDDTGDAPAQPEQSGRIITADEVQPGDKIIVTIPATVAYGSDPSSGMVSSTVACNIATKFRDATIRLIERPLKPIAVGDRVISISAISNGDTATVLHVADGYAMLKFDGASNPGLLKVDSLAHATISPSA